jgi:hypothetical protein
VAATGEVHAVASAASGTDRPVVSQVPEAAVSVMEARAAAPSMAEEAASRAPIAQARMNGTAAFINIDVSS